jgi:hypothetical protein
VKEVLEEDSDLQALVKSLTRKKARTSSARNPKEATKEENSD